MLLWLRKFLVYVLISMIVLGGVVYFLANSPWVIKKAADAFAPDYNISYSRIYGNIVTGVEIDDLAYKNQDVLKHITLKWNPTALGKRDITINNLQIEKLNLTTIEVLVKDFSGSDDNESTEPFTLAAWMPNTLRLENFSLSIMPKTYDPVCIKDLDFKLSDTQFNLESLVLEKSKVHLSVVSNLSAANYEGKVKNNQLLGRLTLRPTETLFTDYNLSLRREALAELHIDLDVTEERVVANIDTVIKALLAVEKEAFNIDINHLASEVIYTFKEATLTAESTASIAMPYSEDILVRNAFKMDDNISYSGTVFAKKFSGIEEKFTQALNDLNITYKGTDKSIETKIDSQDLQGYFVSKDFKKADFHIESKKEIALREYVELPAELNQTKATVVIDVPLDFESNASKYVAKAKIRSNLVNVDADILYDKFLTLKSVVNIPKESLLKAYQKTLKWDNLTPIKSKVTLKGEKLHVVMSAPVLSLKTSYDLNSTKIDGNLHLGSMQSTLSGILDKEMKVDLNVPAISTLLDNINKIITIEGLPPIGGSLNLSLTSKALKTFSVALKSPQITYQADTQTSYKVDNIDMLVQYREGNVTLEHYALEYDKNKLFSTKPSKVTFSDTVVKLSPFWVNDELKIVGEYDLKKRKALITSKAKSLQIAHEIIDLNSFIDITTKLEGEKTSVMGKIVLLGGDIHYDMSQKTFASDSDIIIVQDISEEEESAFMKNLSVGIQVTSKKPLVYNKDAVNIKADVHVSVIKAEGDDLAILGEVKILEGGTYMFEDKKFVLDDSYIHFTGNPAKPLLNVSVKYRSKGYVVTIYISGSAELPQIQFTSKPSLNKNEILSLILFDTVDSSGTNSGDTMMKMMGGAIAKSALSDMGIKVDHLAIGAGNSVEVGKKLTDDITIIYINDIISSVELRYAHTPRTESVFSVSEESQSYDIVYKKDYSEEDMIFFGKDAKLRKK